MIRGGPRSTWMPKAPRSKKPERMPTFGNEYGALVHARLHNQRRLLANKPTFDRVIISGAGGHVKEADLFRTYKPINRGRNMPYAIITSRQWPETRFEYSARNIEEASAFVMHDTRLKSSGVRDYVIITEQDKKGLAKFQLPELEHLFRSLTHEEVPEKIAYNALLNMVADAIGRTKPEVCTEKMLIAYRKTQRPDGSVEHADVVTQDGKKKPSPGASVAEANANQKQREQQDAKARALGKKIGEKAAKASTAKASKKAAAETSKNQSKETPKAETSKGPSTKGRVGAKSGNGAANGKAAPAVKSDGLGRPGTAFRFMAERIMKGEGNDAISKACKKDFPKDKSTDPKHVAWCRWKLRKNGLTVPEPKS